jgi:ParB family chromosome partitioning protein
MNIKRPVSGLGRGLSALMGESAPALAAEEAPGQSRGGVREIEIGRIRPNPNQPRIFFSEESIEELAASIGERGVLQPILLRPNGDGFEIIAGERRWRAAQRARLHSIPAIVRDIDDAATAEIALIENIQREDLSAIEEAEGYRQLIEQHGHSAEDIGRLVHKSRSHVANLLRLLDLPESVRDMVMTGQLSMGHARALISAPDPEALAQEVVSRDLSVRDAEKLARLGKPSRERPGKIEYKSASADIDALQRQLGDMLGLKVVISHKPDGGVVGLHYSTLDQLDMICQRLSGERI